MASAEPVSPQDAASARLAQEENATVNTVSFTGEATTNTSDGRRVIWEQAAFDMRIRYRPPNRSSYAVCAWTGDVESEVCKDLDLGDPQNRTTVVFTRSEWPRSADGPTNLTVELRDSEQTLARYTRELLVLERNTSYDGDSLSNSRELEMNTSVLAADTDMDGINDGVEVRTYGTDPTDPDSDNDGLRDGRELEVGTEPNDPDTDNDGLQDGRELEVGTEPTDPDSDDDGLQDGRELEVGTEPTDPDTDDDGLDDARELELGTNPTDPDTDDDGLSDGTEVSLGTNPTSSTTPFTLVTGVVVTVAVVGLFTVRRVDSVDVEWRDSDQLPLPAPSLSRAERSDGGGEGTTETSRASAEMVQSEDSWPNIADQTIDPDRETVLSILQDNDGRVRQSNIVDVTDWSASKVSRTLSNMEDDDQVSKVTIGRENIVTLYGDQPSTTIADEEVAGGEHENPAARSGPDPTTGSDRSDGPDNDG